MEWSTDWALLFENSAVDDGEVMEVQEWRIDGRVQDGGFPRQDINYPARP